MRTVVLTQEWQVVEVTGSSAIVQGTAGQLYLGTEAPTAEDGGLNLVNNHPIYVNTAVFTVLALRGHGRAVIAG